MKELLGSGSSPFEWPGLDDNEGRVYGRDICSDEDEGNVDDDDEEEDKKEVTVEEMDVMW